MFLMFNLKIFNRLFYFCMERDNAHRYLLKVSMCSGIIIILVDRQMKYSIYILFFLLGLHTINAQVYRTEPLSVRIKSVQVNPVEEWDGLPVISLGENKAIEIKFDEMSHEYKNLFYSVVHCNADWRRSDLTPIEYTQGFPEMPINDYLFSFNTTMAYTNYRMVFPNEDTQFKVSGNYAVEVYDSENKDKPLLTACFSITESSPVVINSTVSANTDIDFNKHHQQVNFSIRTGGYRVINPQQELKVYITQNNRSDNRVILPQPSIIRNEEYVYQHNRALIFEAGNEYRRFETVTTAYQGMGIADVSFHAPYFHLTLYRDLPRRGKSYIYDEDQNGRFLSHCVNCENYDSESDYFFVHFSLDAPEPYLGRVYVLSEAFNYILDARSEMQYSTEEKAYTKTALLKQGAYNYMYLLSETKQPKGLTAPIEGNYFETENEYTIWVYYRGMGDRYDKLVGRSTSTLNNRN